MELNDNNNYADVKLINQIFDIFGWNLQNYKTYQDLALLRADFYPIGYVLAISKKAVIVCEGSTVVGSAFSDVGGYGVGVCLESSVGWGIV